MVERPELSELATFASERQDVLSIYLLVDPSRRYKDECRLTLRNLLEKPRQSLPQDAAKIEDFVTNEFDWQARGLAIFSSQSNGLWRVFPLQVPVADMARVSNRPMLRPLAAAAETFGHYGVILVDREGGQLLHFEQGEIRHNQTVTGEEIHRHKEAEGRGSSAYQKQADEATLRNMRRVAEAIGPACEKWGCQRLIIGGTDENINALLDLLPKNMQDRVVGRMIVDPDAPEAEIATKALTVQAQIDHQHKAALVQDMITMAQKGENAAIGLDEVLGLLQHQRVRTLVIDEQFSVPGWRCGHCGFITANNPGQCPICKDDVEALPDGVDAAVRMALEQKVNLVIVENDEALAKAGNVGALLRY